MNNENADFGNLHMDSICVLNKLQNMGILQAINLQAANAT